MNYNMLLMLKELKGKSIRFILTGSEIGCTIRLKAIDTINGIISGYCNFGGEEILYILDVNKIAGFHINVNELPKDIELMGMK